MKRIRKQTRIVGKFGGKRIKTTAKKWMKMTDASPETPISFKEDVESTKEILNDRNETLRSVRRKLENNEELTKEERFYVEELSKMGEDENGE